MMRKQIKIRIGSYTKENLAQLLEEVNEQNTNRWHSHISNSEMVERCIHNYYSRYMCFTGEEEYMMLELLHKSMYKEVVEALLKEMERIESRISEEVCQKNVEKLEELQCIQENKRTLLVMLHHMNRETKGKERKREETKWGYFSGKRKLKIDLRTETCEQIEKICKEEQRNHGKKLTLEECIETAIDFEYLRTENRGDRSEIYIPLKEITVEELERIGDILEPWYDMQVDKEYEIEEQITITSAYFGIKAYIGLLKKKSA